MIKNKSIQLKAAFLITVFALNMVVAFACSLGLEMGFNNNHHHNGNEEQGRAKHARHSHSTPDHHQSPGPASHHHEKGSPEKDDCCTPNAMKFQQVDKNVNHSPNLAVKTPVFIAFLSAFLGLEIKRDTFYIVHNFLTPKFYPPPDIRIAIQSFQI